MKSLFIALLFATLSIPMEAQNKETMKADRLFARYEYVEAAKEYYKLVEDGKPDFYVYRQLADAYYNIFNFNEAVRWYAKATQGAQDTETYYRYAQMLKAGGRYDESREQMHKFAAAAPDDQRARTFKEDPSYMPILSDTDALYTVKPSTLSSENSDFGAVLCGNTIYFASARNKAGKKYGWTEEPFLDIFKADYGSDGTIANVDLVSSLNTRWHDGPMTVTGDGSTAYFASESYNGKEFQKDRKNDARFSQVYLFRAVKNGDSWESVTALPINDVTYSNSNPSVSRDGKTLYFSSNRPGGLGGTDIWMVTMNADGTSGLPINLGPQINTEGNESFPFISEDNNTLYYASNGKPGLGGYDLFQADLSEGSEAMNMGHPLNTEKDDFTFSYDLNRNVGFLSSNRGGNDDIFLVSRICRTDLIVQVINRDTGAVLRDASVVVVDDRKNFTATSISDQNGEASQRIECRESYAVQVSKEGFKNAVYQLANDTGPVHRLKAILEPIDVIESAKIVMLNSIYFDYDKSNITQEAAYELDNLVQVMQRNTTIAILVRSHADSRGSIDYNRKLSNRRSNAIVRYVISKGVDPQRITAEGVGESELVISCDKYCTEEQHALNRRAEFIVVK